MRETNVRRLALVAALALLLPALLAAAPPAQAAPSHRSAWLPSTPAQWPLVVDEQHTPTQTVTRGVQRSTDTLKTVGGAQVAQVLDADLGDPNLRLGVVESHDHLTDPANEVLTSMAGRTGAVAGVNSDFFDIHADGRPLGMVVIDGRLVKSPNPNWPADMSVRADGSIAIGTETYAGTITDGAATHDLTSVNTVDDLAGNSLVRITPDLGPTAIPTATVVTAHQDGSALVVDAVASGVASLPQLAPGQQDVAGGGAAGAWLAQNVKPGDKLTVHEQLAPFSDLRQAVSGGAILVQNGQMAVPLQGPGENNVNNPVTGLGVTRDGRHLVMAVFDGHKPEGVAEGLTRPQLAGWMMAHGAYNAILFDSGGSSEMVGRLPGQRSVSVLNVPSDGGERPVANGLFIYSMEQRPAPATSVTINDGRPYAALTGGPVPVTGYATDRAGNPAADGVQLSVVPHDLASISGGTLTGRRPGRGLLVARAGHAWSAVPLTVTDRLASLTISPTQPDLDNGDGQQFTVAGTARDGSPVLLPTQAVSWKADPAALGTVTAGGAFTAAPSGEGMVTVAASAGGAGAAASVAVGHVSQLIDPLTDVSAFGLSDKYMNVYPRNVPSPGPHAIDTGTVEPSSDAAQPGDTGSLKLHYVFPGGQHVWHLDLYPNDPARDQIPLRDGQAPEAIGVWVKMTPALQGGVHNGTPYPSEGVYEASTQADDFYPTPAATDGWQLLVTKLPGGLQFPLSFNYLNLVVINPTTTLTGDVEVGDLVALYSPRPVPPFHYVPVPDNPGWLRYASDTSAFRPGGTTLAALDDAHLVAGSPASTESVVMGDIAGRLVASTGSARPDVVQALGDMADDGQLANLQEAQRVLGGIGIPYRETVGNHEIGQGVEPENGNFASVFGPTHYAYDAGAARVMVTDNAHGGILASDAFQMPSEEQYAWLAAQLTAATSRVVIVITHMPAYDPHPAANSQFTDRWEALMYESLLARYQSTHPGRHVVLLFGHARGYAEQMLAPDGTSSAGGLPNFTVADAGAPPYATPDQGGFYNYALFHVLPDGRVQFAVEAVFASVAISLPAAALPVGAREQATATGTTPTGSDRPALQVPVGDPIARTWRSSDPRIASVDPATGVVAAHRPGSVTITCGAGGATGSVALTVRS